MTTTIRARAAASGVAIALTLGLSACGDDGEKAPSAKEAWTKTQQRVAQYKSLRVTGTGQSDKGKTVSVEERGDTKGDNYSVTVSQGDEHAQIISYNKKQFINANKNYYKKQTPQGASMGDSFLAKMADKWIEISTSRSESPVKSMVTHITSISEPMTKQLTSDKASVTADSVNGKDAWKITGADKKSIVWVSKDGKFDLLKGQGVNSSDKAAKGINALQFWDVDKNFDIKAPANAITPQQAVLGK